MDESNPYSPSQEKTNSISVTQDVSDFPISIFLHLLCGPIFSYLIVSSKVNADPWPICFLFYPAMSLGVIAWPLNVFLLFLAIIGFCVSIYFLVLGGRKNRVAFYCSHVFLGSAYMIPTVFERFGTYLGP